MHIRSDRKKLKDGTARSYLSLAHNVWVEGASGRKRAKPVIFARLGVEEDLDTETVESMRDAFDRYLQKRLAREGRSQEAVNQAAQETRSRGPQLRVLASKEYGLRMLVENSWKTLKFDACFRRIARQHDQEFDFERIVFGMVLNRIVDPQSKRACNDWLKEKAYFPEGEEWEVHHFYRALDLLDEHAEDVAKAMRGGVEEQLGPEELELRLVDTTSYESDYDDVERAEIAEEWAAYHEGTGDEPTTPEPQVINEPPFRLRGHSKDRRPDKPQVVIGIVGTTDGRLLSAKVYPGNKNDQKITLDLLEQEWAARRGGQVVAVMDSGMGGGPNLAQIDAAPGNPHRISGVPFRNSRFAEDMVLGRAGRWRQHPGKPHFTYRAVEVPAEESPSGRAEVWVATRNANAVDRAHRKLDRHLERVERILSADDRYEDHNLPVCKLLSNSTLKRYVRISANGKRVLLDRDRIRREERLAGVKVIRSTLVDQPAVVSLQAYEALLEVENGFRTFKTPLRLRPMHHRASRRIRAHVLMCALALACMQDLEHRTGRRFAELRKLFGSVQAIQMEQGQTRFWQRAEWSDETREVLAALGLAEGPRTWGAERVDGDA